MEPAMSSIANCIGSLHGTMVSVRMVLHRMDKLCHYTPKVGHTKRPVILFGITGLFVLHARKYCF